LLRVLGFKGSQFRTFLLLEAWRDLREALTTVPRSLRGRHVLIGKCLLCSEFSCSLLKLFSALIEMRNRDCCYLIFALSRSSRYRW